MKSEFDTINSYLIDIKYKTNPIALLKTTADRLQNLLRSNSAFIDTKDWIQRLEEIGNSLHAYLNSNSTDEPRREALFNSEKTATEKIMSEIIKSQEK